jgi:hypothetical protein
MNSTMTANVLLKFKCLEKRKGLVEDKIVAVLGQFLPLIPSNTPTYVSSLTPLISLFSKEKDVFCCKEFYL